MSSAWLRTLKRVWKHIDVYGDKKPLYIGKELVSMLIVDKYTEDAYCQTDGLITECTSETVLELEKQIDEYEKRGGSNE